MTNMRELAAMRRAIAISAQGLGSTSPNPPVGCVILDREGRTVGEGYHLRKGESHAEVNALKAAGLRAEGGTAVVTLEPCNHYGRTPPCREALISAKVSRVVIAVMDPTSRGEGGAERLRKAGVAVEQGLLEDEALLVLGPWMASLNNDRPFFTWIYEADQEGKPIPHHEGSPAFGEAGVLRQSHDVVMWQSGEVEEGVPGSHGGGVFTLPRKPLGETSSVMMQIFAAAGVRTVLAEGIYPRFSYSEMKRIADKVIAYLPLAAESRTPGSRFECTSAIPEGYRISEVARCGDYIRIAGTHF